ncbi:uncharacterized protein LOC118565681 [Fundulus heteroclitus]|uniref:uncharacterized protein LOC118565681 n=1 Tax=Fundulus heteroclitus TaxID=8078 RepID=UPI00165BB22B|nr:uncharacterized protein LOC118565681 [Fundulus heteroclitus]
MMDHNPCTTRDKTEIPNENSYCMGSRAQNGSNITEITDEDILDSLSTEVKPEATDPGSGELIESEEITQVKIEIDLQNKESGEQRLKQADEKINNCKEDSDLSAQISDSKGFNNHSQSSLNQDRPHLDDDPQRRNEMTTDASETQTQERDDDGEAGFHRDNSKTDDRGESRQKVDQSQITENSVRNKKGQGKKENKDNTISTGKDLSSQRKRKHGDVGEDSQAGTKVRQMEENADNPAQTYNDGNAEDTQKRHTRQKRRTSHETQKKLDLKKTPKYKSYPIRATLTGDHGAERDKETNQQKVQADTSKGSEVAVATGDHSNQSALYFTTVGGDSLDVSANSKGDNEIKIESVQEKSHDSLKRKEMNNDGNGTRGSDHHLLLFAKEEERPVSEPLLPEKQNHTSKEVTREANEDECCVRIVPGAELETLQQEGALKKVSLCKPSVLFLLFLALMCCVLAPLAVWLLCSALLPM